MNQKLFITAMVVLPLFALAAMFAGCNQTTETPTIEAPTTENAPAASNQAQIDALARSYLAVRESLAQDTFEGVSAQFGQMRDAAQALADADDPQVQSSAQALAEGAAATPEDIKQARESFEAVSAAAIDLFHAAPPSDAISDSLHVAYCPMAKASWLQTSKELANPYMGQKMLQCGEIKETIKSDSR